MQQRKRDSPLASRLGSLLAPTSKRNSPKVCLVSHLKSDTQA